jgi:potassium/hydrogen antiporter
VGLEQFFLIGGILLIASIVASKWTGRVGVPALLVFLLIGMLAGSEGPGGIYFDDPALTQSLGVTALIYILFSGGMDTHWPSVRPALWGAVSLATLGVALTALFVGGFAHVALGFSLLEGLLIGAIVSSTDAAAVFAIMRSKGVGLRGKIRPLIELESGSNDPMAVFLTTAFIHLLMVPGASTADLIPMFIRQMLLGALLGFLFGRIAVAVLNRVDLEYEGLYPVLTMAVVLITYSATHLLGGNGFLAVFLAGLVLGNNVIIHRRSLMRFHDGIAWLMQIAMFLTLGLLVFPSRLVPIAGQGMLISLFLILVARPIGVFISLLPFRLHLRDKVMVKWVGLRGAVPIILATFPLLAGTPAAGVIFDLVFFIVLTSVLVQGSSISLVARWLGVDEPLHTRPRPPLEFEPTAGIKGDLVEIEIPAGSSAVGKRIMDLDLPAGALFVLVGREEIFVVPRGNTLLEAGDAILVLADDESLVDVRKLLAVPARPAPEEAAVTQPDAREEG